MGSYGRNLAPNGKRNICILGKTQKGLHALEQALVNPLNKMCTFGAKIKNATKLWYLFY